MHKMTYAAVFEPTKNGYSVYFPDVPGCISVGDTLEDAKREAADALALHLYGMTEDGQPLPQVHAKPTIDPDTAPNYIVAPVTVFPDTMLPDVVRRESGPAAPEYRAEKHRKTQQRETLTQSRIS
ncbi:MAG: type II toxin-antitoxin system HicB family antitoxin [Thermoguttaceae bacterium]